MGESDSVRIDGATMTEEEFSTAVQLVRNKYQSKVAVAKSFMTEEQWAVFRSTPFVRERNDKPRWYFGKERIEHIDKSELLARGDLPLKQHPRYTQPQQVYGKVDWTYHTRVTMDQIRRIISGDYEPKVRVVQPRKGYQWPDKGIIA